MKNYLSINGEKIELSKKTTNEIRRVWGNLWKGDKIKRIISNLPPRPSECDGDEQIECQTIKDYKYVKIPLPICNTKWTLWAFDCVKGFIAEYGGDAWVVHENPNMEGYGQFENHNWIYIKIN